MRLRYLSHKSIFSQLESYFETFWEPIIILDSSFRINQANKKFLELCSYQKEELIGESPSKVLNQFEGTFPVNKNLKLNLSSFEGKIVETLVKSKSGIEIPVKMTFQPFYRTEGVQEYDWFMAVFIRDISYEVHMKRQLNATKEYALNTSQIGGIIYRQTDLGPSAWVKDEIISPVHQKFTSNHEREDEIIRIGLILTTALGQGASYTLGLSELPISDYDIIALCYTTMLKKIESKNKSYVIVAILFPKKLTSLIDKRSVLEEIFKDHFKNIHDFSQLDNKWLSDLKRSLLLFDDGVYNA